MSVMALGKPSCRFFKWGLIRAGITYCQAASTRARRPLPVLVMPPAGGHCPWCVHWGPAPHPSTGRDVRSGRSRRFGLQRGRAEQRHPARPHGALRLRASLALLLFLSLFPGPPRVCWLFLALSPFRCAASLLPPISQPSSRSCPSVLPSFAPSPLLLPLLLPSALRPDTTAPARRHPAGRS